MFSVGPGGLFGDSEKVLSGGGPLLVQILVRIIWGLLLQVKGLSDGRPLNRLKQKNTQSLAERFRKAKSWESNYWIRTP